MFLWFWLEMKKFQYVIEKLKNYNIEFKYFEMLNFSFCFLNELYNVLNLMSFHQDMKEDRNF